MSDVGLAGQQGDSQEDIDVHNMFSEGEELGDEQNVKIQQEEQDKGFLCQHCKQNLYQFARPILVSFLGLSIGVISVGICILARLMCEVYRGNHSEGDE